MKRTVVTLCALCVATSFVIAGNAETDNIALGKPYALNPKPNYGPSKDPGDATQLTDGKLTGLKNRMWVQKESVCWVSPAGKIRPIITIDLGKVEPISGVAVLMEGGNGGFEWPLLMPVLVSDNGKDFYMAGDLVDLTPDPMPEIRGGGRHVYQTRALKTHGRFVRIVLVPTATYAGLDEIKVFRGDDAFLKIPFSGAPANVARLRTPQELTRKGILRRLRMDLYTLRKAVSRAKLDDAEEAQLNQRMEEIQQEITRGDMGVDLATFKAIAPVNDTHRKIMAVYSAVLRKRFGDRPFVWKNYRYDPLDLFQVPRKNKPVLDVKAIQKEHRADVFNVTNPTEKPLACSFRIEGLPGGANPAWLKAYQVEYLDSLEGKVQATPLVELKADNGRFVTTVPAGMTRQIWLSMDTKDLPAGTSEGKVVLVMDNDSHDIPVKLTILPVRMPDKPDLAFAMWDYSATHHYGVTPENLPAALADMREHHVTATWGQGRALGLFPNKGDVDKDGNLTKLPDFTAYDRWISQWPAGTRYLIYAFVLLDHPWFDTMGGYKRGTPQFKRAVSQWAKLLAEHNRKLGLKPGQVIISFIDEPLNSGLQPTLDWIHAFRSGTSDIGVFIDPILKDIKDWKLFGELIAECDIVCPVRFQHRQAAPHVQKMLADYAKTPGKELWFYMCSGPTRHYDPAYYRLQAWYAYAYDGVGAAFWAYSDNGKYGNSWNRYYDLGRINYSPLVFTPDSVVTTKHWEAAREGVQDYQYLVILREKLKESKDGKARDKQFAEKVISNTILNSNPYWFAAWKNGKKCQTADDSRLVVFKVLQRMGK